MAVLLASTSLLTLCALSPVGAPWRLVALPFALVAPGYGAVLVLFGSTRPQVLTTIALSIVLSLALFPLLTLALWAMRIAPTPFSVTVATDIAIIVLARVAVMRVVPRRRTPRLVPLPADRTGQGQTRTKHVAAGAAFLILLACSITVEERLLPGTPTTPYTAFYLAGHWADIGSILVAPASGRLRVRVTVANRTRHAQTYRVVPWAGTERWQVRTIRLASGDEWTGSVSGRVPAGCLRRLRLTLHRQGTAPHSAVGRLTLWVRNAPSGETCSSPGGLAGGSEP